MDSQFAASTPTATSPLVVHRADNTPKHCQLDETLASLQAIIVRVACSTLVPLKPRPSATSIQSFGIQVALVVRGIRSAYLVDTFTIRPGTIQPFLNQLYLQAPSDLAVCAEQSTEQLFFINTPLLQSRIRFGGSPIWVSVSHPPSLTLEPPSFKVLLSQFDLKPCSILTFQAERPCDMIHLCAFLLEYPFAYVVETDSGPFLSDVPLHIYECALDLQGERLTLIKFSVPVECDNVDVFSLLTDKFQQRLDRPVHITRTTAVFDRVAL